MTSVAAALCTVAVPAPSVLTGFQVTLVTVLPDSGATPKPVATRPRCGRVVNPILTAPTTRNVARTGLAAAAQASNHVAPSVLTSTNVNKLPGCAGRRPRAPTPKGDMNAVANLP